MGYYYSMSNEKKFELTPSVSILLAGAIIAGAIIVTNTRAEGAEQNTNTAQVQAPTAETNVPAPTSNDHVIGSPTAPLVLIEYSDFECPFCARVHPTLKRLVEESNGQIAWVYRHLPLESIHAEAKPAAVASECIAEQLGNEAFWQFADNMFEGQDQLGAAYYAQVAQSLGADKAQFNACVTSGKYEQKIAAQAAEAMQNGGQGTPYTIMYDARGQAAASGALPYETFSAVIKAFKERQ